MQNKFYVLDGYDDIVQSYQELIEEAKCTLGLSDARAKLYVDIGIENGVLVEVVWSGREQKWIKA